MKQLTLQERVAGERRRLKTVRQALSTAVAAGAGGDAAYVPFYIAIADYFDAAMHRLHIQDVRMGDMIRTKLGQRLDDRARKALQELDDRLDGNQRHLRELLDCRERLRTRGAACLPEFEQVSRDYTGYITANMGHHGVTTELAQSLFSGDDWAYMASITDEETRHEQALFDKVFALVPAGLKLPVQ